MKTLKLSFALTSTLALAPLVTRAEEFPGGEVSADEFEKGFGEAGGISNTQKDSAEADRLRIGGTLAGDANVIVAEDRDYFYSVSTLWLYFDARLRSDIRAYTKLRGVVLSSDDPNAVASLPGGISDVEEVKLMFNAHKRVFFTVGKQKIKWGSGKFWNPTDVVNSAPRDILYSDDRRSGVSILKTHMPVGSANLYLVNTFDDAERVREIGSAVRAEIPVGPAEFALTAAKFYERDAIFGADVSAGVGPVDVHGEVAFSDGEVGDWVTGVTYELAYNDNDSILFTGEYFHNREGVDSANYAALLMAGTYVPFQTAKHYGMLTVVAPKPGSWNDTTLSLFNLVNLSDGSALSKLSASFTLMQDLVFEPSVSVRYGDKDGELRLLGQKFDVGTRLRVDF